MRHLNSGNKLGVDGPRRKALLRGLTLAILENDSIHTTRARAKELRWWAEHAVTLAKRGDVSGRRQLIRLLGSTETIIPGKNRIRLALARLYAEITPRFKNRSGGYTQIIRLARPRAGDKAEMCIFRYIPSTEEEKKKGAGKKKSQGPLAPLVDKGKKKQASAKSDSVAESGAAAATEDKPSSGKKKSKTNRA